MKRRMKVLAVLLCAASVIVSGCGGTGDSGTAAAEKAEQEADTDSTQ